MIKIAPDGNELWNVFLLHEQMTYIRPWSIKQTSDDGFIIGGAFWNSPQWQLFLLKADDQGNETWFREFGGSGDDFGHSVLQADDGGFVLARYTETNGVNGTEAYVVKTDKNGNSED